MCRFYFVEQKEEVPHLLFIDVKKFDTFYIDTYKDDVPYWLTVHT